MKRPAITAALTLALLASITACGGGAGSAGGDSTTPKAGGTLNVVRSNPFEGFELDKETLNSSYQISQAVIEPLIRTTEDGTGLEPGLAESWEYSKGDTVLTVKLDADAKFSDGKPVTAADVAFSVKTWQAGANYGATYASIASTKVVDDKTIELTLAAPDTALAGFLSWATAGVVPEDFGGRTAAEYWQKPVGAGAFTVSEWSANGQVVLTKNPDYYRDGGPYLDKIVSTYASDPNSITLQMRSGQLDMADEIMPVTAATLPKDQVKAQPQHLTPVLLMNTKDPALADAATRQAIAYAIDYAAISQSALKGYGVAPTGALPTNSLNWAAPSQPYFTLDTAKSQELLKNEKKTLSLVYPNDPSSTLMAQIIQQNLAAVGITVELQSADSATAFAAESSGEYQLGIFSYNAISPDVADPAWYVAGTSTMFTGLPADDAIAALTDYAATTDTAKKKAAVTKLQDIWFEQAPFVALAHTSALEGQRDVVHDAHVTPWGTYYFDTVWKN
ncbi:ABC transporter substrate-binding protein [Actinoplanes sp. CA-015351]|uniref:ABC transporter substrate-binding protein n=1 Tax=Actinoplanes sp. CA-015351 TaxID=3239897 RepID=UPI003D9963EA